MTRIETSRETSRESIKQLPEFSLEIPKKDEVAKIAEAFRANRYIFEKQAENFGIESSTILDQNDRTVIVAPFIYPSPLSTTYAGDPENLSTSTELTTQLSEALERQGYSAQAYSMVTLAMSEVPKKSNKDSLILPKSVNGENQKITLFGQSEIGKAYAFVQMSYEDYQRIRQVISNSFNQYKDRTPRMKELRKEEGRKILDAAISDLDYAWQIALIDELTSTLPYLQFAKQYNNRLAQRVDPNYSLPTTPIDTAVYSPFFTQDITDIEVFMRRFVDAGVITVDQNVFKVINARQKTEMLQLAKFESSDLLLRFASSGKTIRFSELKKQDVDISACKELTYVMCFANLIPIIYGDINNDLYYEPYAKAKQQVQELGFNPVLYRIQPQTPQDVQQFPTLFDYYMNAIQL